MVIKNILSLTNALCITLTTAVATLPFSINLSSYFVVASMLLWLAGILNGRFKWKWDTVKILPVHFLPVILALVGLVHTENIANAYGFLTRLASFIAFPLIMSTTVFGNRNIMVIHLGLLTGSIATYLYALFLFLNLQPETSMEVLLQENFIFRFNAFVAKEMIHPTYLAMYFMLCLFWLLERFMIVRSAGTKGLLLGASGGLLLLTVSLAAKMPLLELGIILLTVPAIYLLRNRKTKKLYWYLVGLTGLITLVVIFLFRVPNRAVQDVYDYYNFLSGKQLTDFYSYDELEVEYDKFWFEKTNRIVIWQNSIELAKAKPWIGYGTGDVQDKLIEVYQKNKELWRMQFFNSHNQFLDYQLRYGVLGALLLGVYLGYFFIYALKNGDYLYLSLIAMIGLGFLTENIIQRHWGIVFFSLFNSLYYFRIRNETSD